MAGIAALILEVPFSLLSLLSSLFSLLSSLFSLSLLSLSFLSLSKAIKKANPNLKWHEVQEIFIEASQMIDVQDPGWQFNGASKPYHHQYGFVCFVCFVCFVREGKEEKKKKNRFFKKISKRIKMNE